jgi:hypothetical protein
MQEGGCTYFPNIERRFQPKRGSAVLWYNRNRDGQMVCICMACIVSYCMAWPGLVAHGQHACMPRDCWLHTHCNAAGRPITARGRAGDQGGKVRDEHLVQRAPAPGVRGGHGNAVAE